jgi:hypothetical protein
MSKVLKVNEMDDFSKEIAKDLFNRLPKSDFSEDDFLNYMKEKGSSDLISKEVLSHLKYMRFPFSAKKIEKNSQAPIVTGDKLEVKSKKIKTYEEETTLVVVGSINHNDESDVEIIDDYTNFKILIGDKKVDCVGAKRKCGYESDGFISIMTLTQFKKWKKMYSESLESIDAFLLPNFKGTIGITAEVEGQFTDDFDLSDYIQHQDGLDECMVYLTFPEGTQISEIN